MKPKRSTALYAFVAGLLVPAFGIFGVEAALININPSLDNSIYAENDNSNAQGSIFVGLTLGTDDTTIRRGLVQFDVAGSLPAGSIINSVSLTLETVIQGPSASNDILELHPVSAAWGEGTSSGIGRGDAPTPNEATWNFRIFNSQLWINPGGDFGATSGTTTLGFGGQETFDSQPGMVADVQNWLNTPASNFGWLLKYSDEFSQGTARAFGSRESPGQQPTLTIDFTVVPEPSRTILGTLGVIGALLMHRRRI